MYVAATCYMVKEDALNFIKCKTGTILAEYTFNCVLDVEEIYLPRFYNGFNGTYPMMQDYVETIFGKTTSSLWSLIQNCADRQQLKGTAIGNHILVCMLAFNFPNIEYS
ncbi:hypothetical protein CYMTET_54139 [Cymbomonas tetramitiformis]|uniref:Uncharacterized protein n=1 Tax=Cymbomonas tetramitiformis TaxID=36881 RepID=A0AAE0EP15_9CHLO|nr:hypothetical protein CYMTET_54139 [Cymbomonas tetramitiformis]